MLTAVLASRAPPPGFASSTVKYSIISGSLSSSTRKIIDRSICPLCNITTGIICYLIGRVFELTSNTKVSLNG